MTAAVWCKEHVPTKTIVHRMHDVVDEESGLNALQLYVQNFKQADLGLTGTVRKATLVSQSTKVANPITSTASPQNRRTSTTVHGNGNGNNASRSSVSHVKADVGLGETSSTLELPARRTCATCSVEISPKWWPFPPAPAHDGLPLASDGVLTTERDKSQPEGSPLTNGHVVKDLEEENSSGHVALAAAALHSNPGSQAQDPPEFQCHQCHWKKKQRPLPLRPTISQQDKPRLPLATPLPSPSALPHDEVTQQPPHLSPYSWPPGPQPPTSYSANGSSGAPGAVNGTTHATPYAWSRPSPTPQIVPLVGQLNGNHSPRVSAMSLQSSSGQSQIRHNNHSIPPSPHQNGHHPQLPNGYPPSPRRHSQSSPGLHVQSTQNGAYTSYASTRPPPQHLTNGGPPPRAPEHPFSQGSMHMHRGSFGHVQGNPSILHDNHAQSRDQNGVQSNGARHSDGRVNGGASASPSLRNLLS